LSERKAKVLEMLRKLEKLRQEGLLTEEEYRTMREKLIDAFLQEEITYHESGIKERPSSKSKVFSIAVIVIAIVSGILIAGIVGYIFLSSLTSSNKGAQVITKTVDYGRNYSYNVGSYPTIRVYPTVRTIYSGALTLEENCRMYGWSIQAKRGDVISVYWESNDRNTYVAIATDADRERNRQYYCEVLIPFWKTSWPMADYGYSGRLEFSVPSSGVWYVIVANGHWECVFTKCPITVTKLEITHTSS
jgi:hypothetical protein